MKKYSCNVCGYVYEPELNDLNGKKLDNIISFEDLPEDWVCPICGVGKDEFSVDLD